jgi:hypothetical protein
MSIRINNESIITSKIRLPEYILMAVVKKYTAVPTRNIFKKSNICDLLTILSSLTFKKKVKTNIFNHRDEIIIPA